MTIFNQQGGEALGRVRYGPRNERDMGDYAKCKLCAHEKTLHINGTCYSCGCQSFSNAAMENMACPVCSGNKQGMTAMVDHLEAEHDMTREQAERALGA